MSADFVSDVSAIYKALKQL